MNLKKIAKKGGFGLVGKLATGNIRGAFPVLDVFHSGFTAGVNDNNYTPKKKKKKRFNY